MIAGIQSVVFSLLGIDRSLIERCPPRDRANVLMVGAILALVFGWLIFVYAGTLHVLLRPEGRFEPWLLLFAVAVGVSLVLVEVQLIIKPSWLRQGEASLRRELPDLPPLAPAGFRSAAAMSVRFLETVPTAGLFAILASATIFATDAGDILKARAQSQNAPVAAAIEERIDAPLQQNLARQETLRARIAEDDRQIAALRNGAAADSPELTQQLALVSRLTDSRSAAEAELSEAQQRATDELAGFPGQGLSGREGAGPRYRAAVARTDDAAARISDLAQQLGAAQDRLAQLRREAEDLSRRTLAQSDLRLQGILDDRKAAEDQLATLAGEFQLLLAGRTAAVSAALQADPNARVPPQGVIARLGAIWEAATSNPESIMLFIFAHLLSLGLELGAVFAVTALMPTTYGRLLAFQEYEADHRVAETLARLLNGGKDPPAPTPASPVEVPPEGPGPEGAEAVTSDEPAALPPERTPSPALAMQAYFHEMERRAGDLDDGGEVPAETPALPPLAPPRRGRGRPRKSPATVNGTGTSAEPGSQDDTAESKAQKR